MSISRDEWLAALGEAVAPADPDAVSVDELGKLVGLRRTAAKAHADRLVTEGRAIRTVKFNARGQRVGAYKLVTPAKAKRKAA